MKPTWILRAEGLALLLTATCLYRLSGHSWALYAAAFLVPDVGLLGYLTGPRLGAWTYNLSHTTVLPLAWSLGLWAQGAGGSVYALPALWLAHIGFDRCLGYGLKRPEGFQKTHLQD